MLLTREKVIFAVSSKKSKYEAAFVFNQLFCSEALLEAMKTPENYEGPAIQVVLKDTKLDAAQLSTFMSPLSPDEQLPIAPAPSERAGARWAGAGLTTGDNLAGAGAAAAGAGALLAAGAAALADRVRCAGAAGAMAAVVGALAPGAAAFADRGARWDGACAAAAGAAVATGAAAMAAGGDAAAGAAAGAVAVVQKAHVLHLHQEPARGTGGRGGWRACAACVAFRRGSQCWPACSVLQNGAHAL